MSVWLCCAEVVSCVVVGTWYGLSLAGDNYTSYCLPHWSLFTPPAFFLCCLIHICGQNGFILAVLVLLPHCCQFSLFFFCYLFLFMCLCIAFIQL
ncbi:hypothetical protein SRHO_G00151680 [Serrasalmus rhombeus]